MAKTKPTGWVATCQCGVDVGAIDAERTERTDAGKILGRWIADGCTITPQFAGSWSAKIESCRCANRREAGPDSGTKVWTPPMEYKNAERGDK